MKVLGVVVLLTLATAAAVAQATWVDPSPHVQRFVQVEPGVSVEVLDWGGLGRTLVLLGQLGQTSHIYDDWAPLLAQTYRVVGITRRGFGQSSTASDTYSTERLALDVLSVLTTERLQRPILVGNGFAGEEMSWIGARFPERIAGLAYVDAAYDRSRVGEEAAIARRIPARPPQPGDMGSAQSVAEWMSRGAGGRIPESEVRQLAQFGPDGRVLGQRTPARIPQAVLEQLVRVDPATIRVPILAIYGRRTSADSLPGCATDDRAIRDVCDELFAWLSRQLADSQRLFGATASRTAIVEIPGGGTFVFLSHQRAVTDALQRFAAGLPN